MYVPRYVSRFRDALVDVRVGRLSIESCTPPVEGVHGILTTTRLQYSDEPWQLLGREHEYLFWLPGADPIEVSVQLYLNDSGHWRLFAYSNRGMLFSVNLTRTRGTKDVLTLQQKLALYTRSMTSPERRDATSQLAEHLRRIGFEVSAEGRLVLGTFDGRNGVFVDTTARAFVRDFILASVLKGHFMGNKGYRLPGIVRVKASSSVPSRSAAATKRAVPLGLRYRVLERDEGRCCLCGADASDGTRLHVDHIVPWSHGGRTDEDNLQTLCDRCNLGKGNRSARRHRASRNGKKKS